LRSCFAISVERNTALNKQNEKIAEIDLRRPITSSHHWRDEIEGHSAQQASATVSRWSRNAARLCWTNRANDRKCRFRPPTQCTPCQPYLTTQDRIIAPHKVLFAHCPYLWCKCDGHFHSNSIDPRMFLGSHVFSERNEANAYHLRAEARGHNSPGVESLWGRPKVSTTSKVLSSVQHICFRKTSGSNMGASNLLLAPGAI